MMSFDKNTADHVNQRLPSFTELTSTFSNSIKISGSKDGNLITNPNQAPEDHFFKNQASSVHHQPPYATGSFQISNQNAQNRIPPELMNFKFPQNLRSSRTQVPIQAPVAAPTHDTNVQPLFRHNSIAGPFQTSPPQPLQSDSNYIISSQSLFPFNPVINSAINPQGFHEIARRHSMNISPSHSKKESWDTQTSLNTLANIASYKPNIVSLSNLLGELEHNFLSFNDLQRNINDIRQDFMDHLKLSATSKKETPQENLSLKYDYNMNELGTVSEYGIKYFEKLLNNIPIQTITDSIKVTNDLNNLLQHLMIHKEHKTSQANLLRQHESTIASKKREMASSPAQPMPSSPTSPPLKFNQNYIINEGVHQQYQNNQYRNASTSSATSASTKKKRKPSKTPIKTDNLSLVVRTPKPSNNSQKVLDYVKGQFREGFALKPERKCVQCGSDDTPEWRKGPYGFRSLCNACGLFYGKLIKKFGVDHAATIMKRRKEKGNGDDRRIPNGLE